MQDLLIEISINLKNLKSFYFSILLKLIKSSSPLPETSCLPLQYPGNCKWIYIHNSREQFANPNSKFQSLHHWVLNRKKYWYVIKYIFQTSYKPIIAISCKCRAGGSYWICDLFVPMKRYRCEWQYKSSWHEVLDCLHHFCSTSSTSFLFHCLQYVLTTWGNYLVSDVFILFI